MEQNTLGLFLSGIIFFMYSAACILSLVLTFSNEAFRKLDEKLSSELVSTPTLSPVLEKKITHINNWIVTRNRIVGPILIVLSIINLNFCFLIIRSA